MDGGTEKLGNLLKVKQLRNGSQDFNLGYCALEPTFFFFSSIVHILNYFGRAKMLQDDK